MWCSGHDLLLINAEVGSEEVQGRVKELLKIGEMAPQDDTGVLNLATQWFQCIIAFRSLLKYYYYMTDDKKPAVSWMKHENLDGITLIHQKVWYSDFNFFSLFERCNSFSLLTSLFLV